MTSFACQGKATSVCTKILLCTDNTKQIFGRKMKNDLSVYNGECGLLIILLVSSQEHSPSWNPLDDWERVKVLRPFYSLPPAATHYIGDCDTFSVDAIELRCFVSFASEVRWPWYSLAISRHRLSERGLSLLLHQWFNKGIQRELTH
jgi:hypothetical protein